MTEETLTLEACIDWLRGTAENMKASIEGDTLLVDAEEWTDVAGRMLEIAEVLGSISAPTTANERVASIVAYLHVVAEQQDGYAQNSESAIWAPGEKPGGGFVYTKRLRERAFMARALAKRIARGEDLRPGAYLQSLSTGPYPTGEDDL